MGGIVIVAEHYNGALRDITRELVGAAQTLKAGIGGPVSVVVLSDGLSGLAEQAKLNGVDEIRAVDIGTAHFDAVLHEEALYRLGLEMQPALILFGHTANGIGIAPAVAARLGSGFASDVFALNTGATGPIATRSAYNGKLHMEVEFPNKGVVVMTLRGATFKSASAGGSATIITSRLDVPDDLVPATHVGYAEPQASGIDISRADFILSIGRGIGEEKNIPRFAALAERLGATLGCSRPIVDAGWLPKPHQVGQSGKVAANCKLYVALGISGAVQHLYGMKHVDTIIAVNTDANAPIFNWATYGVNMDVSDFADALEKQIN